MPNMDKKMPTDFDVNFSEVLSIIQESQSRVIQNINRDLIHLYWQVGEYVSNKTLQAGWGKGTVEELSFYIHRIHPEMKGFTARNIWRMKQFFDTYTANTKLSALLTELTWTNNLLWKRDE